MRAYFCASPLEDASVNLACCLFDFEAHIFLHLSYVSLEPTQSSPTHVPLLSSFLLW